MYDIPKAISSFFDALKSIFALAETSKKQQCETDVLKTKKNLCRKSDKQEDLILDMARLLERYIQCFSKTDRLRARIYIRRVKRTN